MEKFIKNYRIFLTPISPIHIGCGEDFEPTNYVIKDQVLYHFEPSKLYLSEQQREKLLQKVNQLSLLEIQRFFVENSKQAIDFSHYLTNVSKDIEHKWESKVGKVVQRESNNNEVLARLAIERASYLPFNNDVYIPGSSFKGALATALLSNAHKQAKTYSNKVSHDDLLKKYLGVFADSKLRFVKFSDFIPTSSAHSQVYYALNYKKRPIVKDNNGKGISIRRECILQGQYRKFTSDLTLWKDLKQKEIDDINTYFSELNLFYQPIFEKECEVLVNRGFISNNWVKNIKQLIMDKQVALIRLGKNGADSKVYPEIAQIKIMKGKGKGYDTKDSSTTVWLAGNTEHQQNDLLPFGWALLEVDSGKENTALKQWCDNQLEQIQPFNKTVFQQTQQEKLAEEKQKQANELAERLAKEAEKTAQEQAEQARLESLSPNALLVETFLETHKNGEIKQHTDSLIFREAKLLIEKAIQENWTIEDKTYLFEQTSTTEGIIHHRVKLNSDKAKKEFNKLRNKLMVL